VPIKRSFTIRWWLPWGDDVAIDFYIYNNDFNLFKKLLQSKKEDYSHYVIIPHFIEGGQNANEVINAIPKDKLILLDKNIPASQESIALCTRILKKTFTMPYIKHVRILVNTTP
jgi:hypothetical protein